MQRFQTIIKRCFSLTLKKERRNENESEILGGVSRNYFLYLIEKGTPFIRQLIQLKLQEIQPGAGTMILTFPSSSSSSSPTTSTSSSSTSSSPTTSSSFSTSSSLSDGKYLHDGVLVTAIDHTGGFCAWSKVKSYLNIVSTMNLHIDYYEPLLLTNENGNNNQNGGSVFLSFSFFCLNLFSLFFLY